MEYFIYLFIIVCLVIILHRLKLISFARLIPRIKDDSTSNSLEHDDLLALFDKFHYKHADGVCHGFTLTWAQEAALGLDSHFYNRLNLIKREKQTLPNTLHLISEKVKSSHVLSLKEQKLNEIKPFLEAICLAQSPDAYDDVYARSMQQSSIDVIYKMIQLNLSQSQNRVKNVFKKTIAFASRKEVNQFLTKLNKMIPVASQVAIVCSSEEHDVGFKKHKEGMWLFININQLYEQNEEYPYHFLTDSELSDMLYRSLFETSEQLVLHCSFITTLGQRKLLQNLRTIDESYPITSRMVAISNCRAIGPLSFAIQNEDMKAFGEILLLSKKRSISETELQNALFYVASCNRSRMLKQMITILKIDINMSCNESGDTALSIACSHAHTSVVQVLLHNHANVNATNSKEMTPLMLACESHDTAKHPELFSLLLGAGADVDSTNDHGETAYDIAVKCDNQTAMRAITAYKAKELSKDLNVHQQVKTKKIVGPSGRNTLFRPKECRASGALQKEAIEGSDSTLTENSTP